MQDAVADPISEERRKRDSFHRPEDFTRGRPDYRDAAAEVNIVLVVFGRVANFERVAAVKDREILDPPGHRPPVPIPDRNVDALKHLPSAQPHGTNIAVLEKQGERARA
jgi:hypothetical protein